MAENPYGNGGYSHGKFLTGQQRYVKREQPPQPIPHPNQFGAYTAPFGIPNQKPPTAAPRYSKKDAPQYVHPNPQTFVPTNAYQNPERPPRGAPRNRGHRMTEINEGSRSRDTPVQYGEIQVNNPHDEQKKGGKGNKYQPFWKDKEVNDPGEQKKYIGHCRKWMREEDKSLLVKRIREAPEPLQSIVASNKLEHEVIDKLLEILTCDNLIKPLTYEKTSALMIFSMVINSQLITSTANIQEYTDELFENFEQDSDPRRREYNFTKLKNVYKLLEHLLSINESESAVLWPLIRILRNRISGQYTCTFPDGLSEDIIDLYDRCKKLKDHLKEVKKKKAENKQFEDETTDYGCLYKEMSILPSKSEITKPDNTKLRKLLKIGSYKSAEMYLDIHFKLLREDMIRPLRQGIQNFLKDRMENVRRELYMYEKVRIVEMYCEPRQGLLYRIKFTTCNVRDPSRIRWDRVQRLKFGTLLCILTYGANNLPSFDRPLWAVVANRDEKELSEHSQISIRFQAGFQPDFEFNQEYFIVESRQVYYEAYYHTLTVLKEMTPETIPLKQIILGETRQCDHPNYLTHNPKYIFENIFPLSPHLSVLGHWPPESDVLDPSQYKALKLALTKEVALIQGPPGTGKTYVGAHALRVILSTRQHILQSIPKPNISAEDNERFTHFLREMGSQPTQPQVYDTILYRSLCQYPILIVTYTNHALDQFLEYILPFEDNIIRIGTRSENEELKEKTLPKISKKVFDRRDVPHEVRQMRYRTFDLQKELKNKQGVIKEASQKLSSNTLSKEELAKYLDTRQYYSLFEPEVGGFIQVKKSGKSTLETWLEQHAPMQQRRNSAVKVTAPVNNKSKKKNKKKGNPITTTNKFGALMDHVDDDDDEMVQNVDEKRKEILQDLDLLPPQEPQRIDLSPSSHSLLTPLANTNPFYDPAFEYSNLTDPNSQTYSNIPPSQFDQHYVRNLSNVNHPPFDYTNLSSINSRPDSPMSMISVATVDIIDTALPITNQDTSPVDVNEDIFLHHDSDDDDAVDAPFQNFYDELKEFGGLTLEEAKLLYYVDTQTGDHVLPDNIMNCANLWDLNHEQRNTLYDFMLERRKQECNQILTSISNEYTQLLNELQEKQRQLDVFVLKQAAIVGMTTTGAARHFELLTELNPRIIFVEEAAEVLEAHILACLSVSVEHLILIGDHQQLRPNNAVHELSTKYNLNISLFERLVNNKVEHVTLGIQHRMRPEISALIKPIYKDLQDYHKVLEYPNVKGVMRNIFFIDHRKFEDRLQEDSTSHVNKHEAEFIAHFTKYLLKQGYEGSELTILTFYMGQKFKILDSLRKLGVTAKIRCTTVDKYQGEENKIIIFSVVRSNHENKIGYCKVDNRVCVALSRAKYGFFIIGNMECLIKAESETHLWRTVIEKFKENVGPSLPLSCQNHPKKITMVSLPRDFDQVKNGGCDLPCDMRLDCGHQCQQLCHPDGHDEVKCQKECTRIHEPCKHPCVRASGRIKRCYEECDRCLYPVKKYLEVCGHEQKMACSDEPLHSLCQRPCDKILLCLHPCTLTCGEPCENSVCIQPTKVKLLCGHDNTVLCKDALNLLSLKCKAKCDEVLECGDICPGTCGDCLHGTKHIPCDRNCGKPLICSHPCQENCHRPKVCSPCKSDCINCCPHTRCGLPCGELCVPCIELCDWACEHYRCTNRCYEPCNRNRCNYLCKERLRCKHRCMGLCGEPCPKICKICTPNHDSFEIFFGNEDEEDARFLQLEDCGHIFEVSGFDNWMDVQKGGRENTGKIQLPFCPLCKTPIRKNLRYGKIIKEALISIEDVKRKVQLEMRRNVIAKCGEIINTIQENYLELNFAKNEIVQHLHECSKFAQRCDHTKLYVILDLLKIFADLYETPEHVWKSCQAHKAFLRCYKVEKLLENPKSKKTDKLDLHDLETLTQRCLLSSLFSVIGPIVPESTPDKDLFTHLRNRFVSSLIQNANFSNAQLIRDCELFLANAKLKYRYAPVTQQERVQIARAIDVNSGGWYRCRNGHLYGIGDCGGAVERSVCNECGAAIGGTGHRVDDDNLYAGQEMGGNMMPAWPGQPGFP